jgi:hypothetical protein
LPSWSAIDPELIWHQGSLVHGLAFLEFLDRLLPHNEVVGHYSWRRLADHRLIFITEVITTIYWCGDDVPHGGDLSVALSSAETHRSGNFAAVSYLVSRIMGFYSDWYRTGDELIWGSCWCLPAGGSSCARSGNEQSF